MQHANHKDLHPYCDSHTRTIEFRLFHRGHLVRIDVPRETLSRYYEVGETRHGLLMAYEQHREEIDAAVLRRAAEAGAGVTVVRPDDLRASPPNHRRSNANSRPEMRPESTRRAHGATRASERPR